MESIWSTYARVVFAFALAVSSLMLSLSPVLAGFDQPVVKRMQVSVWPEFDEPRVLVIYQGELDDTVVFPRTVYFRLPAGAEINQVCALRPQGEHLCQYFELTRDETGVLLTYDLPMPRFFLEFYYHPVEGAGERHIDFEFRPELAVETLTLEVQQPARATDFALVPAPTAVQYDAAGLRYHLYNFTDVVPGDAVRVDLRYAKDDALPSTEKRQVVQGNGSGSRADDFAKSWLVVGLGSVTVASIVGYSAYRRRHLVGRVDGEVQPCRRCGGWVGRYNQYCPVCGERVVR